MASVTEKVVVVTGAAGGIGSAVCQRLVEGGAAVHCLDLDGGGVAKLADRIGAVASYACDTSDKSRVDSVIENVIQLAGHIDALVNVSGVHQTAEFVDITEDDFDRIIRVNVKGAFLPSQAVARAMIDRNRGRGGAIINFASLAAEHVSKTSAAYATSKGAVVSMTRGMATSLGRHGIRANAIAPGPIDTPMTAKQRKDPKWVEWMLSRIPLGRSGVPADVAALVSFLVSDDAAWMTGELIHLDGGVSVLR